VTRKLQIVRGSLENYKELADYHYRDSRLGPFTAIFAIKPTKTLGGSFGETTVGVIVYTMPSPEIELRNIATGGLFGGFDRATHITLVNKNIRCIGRVIIEPRFRGLGLASRLVRETMPKIGAPIVEALAVMGLANPFFEKAGMRAYTAKMPARCVQLAEAFNAVGIEKQELLNPQKVHQKLEELGAMESQSVELQIKRFLQSYGKRRNMSPGLERTRFVLSKLTKRPVYYIWLNPELNLITS